MTARRAGGALLGRDTQLAALQRLLDDARSGGRGRAVLVGEPGIGKTRLLRELCQRAEGVGFAVLSGRGSEFEQDVPFGLFADALDEPLRAVEPLLLRRLGAERIAELAAVLPSLEARGDGTEPGLAVERYRSHDAVRDALADLARQRPLLVALDDVHWADPASLELLSSLLRRGVRRALVVCAYRPHQAPAALRHTVDVLAQEQAVEIVGVEPLTESDSGRLLGADVSGVIAHELFEQAGGNPFYLEQLGRTVGRTVMSDRPAGEDAGVPVAVRAAIADELDRLTGDGRRFLAAAAVAGDQFEVDLAAEIAGLADLAALEALDELTAVDLIRETDVPREMVFRHPIVRRAVYDATPPGWRIAAHGTAARYWQRRGAPLSVRAGHVERSASPGDETAIALLTDAGAAAEPRAPATAARWFRAALRLMPKATEPDRRIALLTRLAGALASTGQLVESIEVLAEAIELVPPESEALRWRLRMMEARAVQALGYGDVTLRLLASARAQVAPASRDAAMLALATAESHAMTQDWEGACEYAAEGLRIADDAGHTDVVLAATASLAYMEQYLGPEWEQRAADRYAQAKRDLDATVADRHLSQVLVEAMGQAGFAAIGLDRLGEAVLLLERALRLARWSGYGYLIPKLTSGLAAARLQQGDLLAARTAADEAAEMALLLDNDQAVAFAQGLRAWVAGFQGDLDVAVTAGERAVAAAEKVPASLYDWMAHACSGEALVLAGEPVLGRERILAAGGVELTGIPPNARVHWHSVLALAEVAEGRLEAAEAMVARAEDGVSPIAVRLHPQAHAAHARAAVLLARGECAAAARAAQGAAQRYEEAGRRLLAARSRLLVGRALAAQDAEAVAEVELRAAHAVLEECGAVRLADEAARELRTVGARVLTRRPASTGGRGDGPALSAREEEVAERVARGLTNRQIAAELFVGEKTVEKHISRVFAKLGVSSRAAAAVAFERRRGGLE